MRTHKKSCSSLPELCNFSSVSWFACFQPKIMKMYFNIRNMNKMNFLSIKYPPRACVSGWNVQQGLHTSTSLVFKCTVSTWMALNFKCHCKLQCSRHLTDLYATPQTPNDEVQCGSTPRCLSNSSASAEYRNYDVFDPVTLRLHCHTAPRYKL